MLRDRSVRSVMILLLLSLFLFNLLTLLFFKSLVFCFFLVCFLFSVHILLAWFYLDRFLVIPINKVVSALSVFNEGDFSLRIPEFGKNCAGRIIPGINSLSVEMTSFVSGIRNWEILLKHLVEALVLAILGRGVHLEKISE